MNRRNHSFVMESKLHDVKGRVDYISSPKRQENLYAVFSNVEDSYWDLLAEQNQRDFAKSGTEGTCKEKSKSHRESLPSVEYQINVKSNIRMTDESYRQG